ncbi:uncharacterized protein LY89DRAFT_778337 [Mollisia scopiformis]|uniref:Rho-GAP domain-containing protein n=1 Tax=Mollisia scopiformis TaxID=149040 RepID=A0A194XPJ5_MOLSC|nr:uncharacterized protein LY89DRAFT_778337 [Mollisia scopiformis]KUJ21994.1 hypothetical protein LY89DRAFT_778337 [Mollisia scopiformis]
MAQTNGVQDPISITIAQELLNRPNHTRQRSAFTTASARSHQFDGTDNPQQAAEVLADPILEGRSRRAGHTSNTWTSSSGDVVSDQDEIDDRTFFVQEYNRLARKHGVRVIVPEEHEPNDDSFASSVKQHSWFSRKILRRTSSSQSVRLKNDRHLKHMRSISDSLRMKKRDRLKDKDLQDLARLCGLSLLYLPTEYAAGSLSVPTCFRATAQFLVQHAPSTRGVFRIPGSQNAVAALYNHYCSMDEEGQVIAGTVRCPTLPDHIRCDTHDVASAFKRFLAGIPGGILGSLALFNAFISIQTQLDGDAELTRTKQSKVRARLIALAVATLRSQYRRELISAVFGLLSMIGRAAETAPREDERGRPLPTSDLMGYGPLGIVFGPLLVGDLLEDYTVRLVNPHGGLILLPISPPKSRKERSKKTKSGDEGTTFSNHIDKIKVANSITEMLITHWRDVVRHMKNLSALKVVAGTQSLAVRNSNPPMLRPSASETFALRKPPDWDQFGSPLGRRERSVSPTPNRRPSGLLEIQSDDDVRLHQVDILRVKKQRMKQRATSNHRLSGHTPKTVLAPTREEIPKDTSSHLANRGTSESKPRSRSGSFSEVEKFEYPRRHQDGKLLHQKIHTSNGSSDKENKPPSSDYRSVLDPGRQKVDDEDGQLHTGKREMTDQRNTSDEGTKIKGEHSVVAAAKSTTEMRNRTREKTSEASSSAKASKTNTPPLHKRHSPSSTFRGSATQTSGDEPRKSKADSAQGPNKLTKSAERAKAREDGLVGRQKAKNDTQDTPYKKWKKGRKSAIKSSTSEIDTKHQALQVDDKFWPLDRLPGSSPSAHRSKLEITITRSSSGDLGEVKTDASRRVGGSEPGSHPIGHSLTAPGYRRVSRSLDDNLRRRNKHLDLQRSHLSKDPLSRISHEEDLASLAALAKALDSADVQAQSPDVSTGHGSGISLSVHQSGTIEYQSQVSDGPGSPRKTEKSTTRESDEKSNQQRSSQHHNQDHDSLSFNKSATSKTYSGHVHEGTNVGQTPRIQGDPARAPSNLDSRTVQFTPRKRTGSPRSPSSKISALVAKYNNGDSAPVLPPSTPSPLKSTSKSIPREVSRKIEAPQDGLIAPYTINPPSPTRSQMSGKSEKTPQSRRTPDATLRPLNVERNISPTKIPAPKRVLRSSLDDATPLRPVQKSVENAFIPSSVSPSKIPRARPETAEPAQRYLDGSASNLNSRTPSQIPDLGKIDPAALVVQRLARSTSRTSTPPPSIRRSLDEAVTEMKGPIPSLLHPAALRSVREMTEVSIEDTTGIPSCQDATSTDNPEVVAVDGPAGELKIHQFRGLSELAFPARMRHSVHEDLPEFVHPESPFKDTFSNPTSPISSHPPTRRNSLLYLEIQKLEKKLATEKEEVLQLKQQLEARQNLDVGSLSEELREAKKELQKWKTRAKVAEKQLELLFKNPSRSMSTQLAYSSMSRVSDRVNSSRTDGPSDSLTATETLRKVFNGTDGAASSEESDYSTNTVVRDVQDIVTGSEYSVWVEQTMNALGGAEVS